MDSKGQLLFEYLLSNPEAFATCKPILNPEWFPKHVKPIVRYVLDHVSQYNTLPNVDIIKVETGAILSFREDAITRTKWLLDEVETYCRTSATIEAVTKAADAINDGNFSTIVDDIKKAVQVGLSRDIGLDYFANPIERLKRLLSRGVTPTGFRDIDDKLYGGIETGGVNILIANSGVGKSIFLANEAIKFLERGKFVAYLSLELTQDKIGQRADAMLTGVPLRDVLGKMEQVAEELYRKRRNYGKYIIKYMPAQSNCIQIEAWIRELVTVYGQAPDLLLVDYIDLVAPNNSKIDLNNVWLKDKYVTEELRNLQMEFQMCGWSASQMTRESIGTEDQHQGHIAGGITKINTADIVMSAYVDQKLKEANRIKYKFLKTRNSAGVGQSIELGLDPDTLLLYDVDQNTKKKSFVAPTPASQSRIASVRNRIRST